jgi:hypothetical protein
LNTEKAKIAEEQMNDPERVAFHSPGQRPEENGLIGGCVFVFSVSSRREIATDLHG